MSKIGFLCLIAFACFIPDNLSAQTYILGQPGVSGNTITTCSGVFYDPGGPTSNYGNNLDYDVTFTTGNPNEVIVFDFSAWGIEYKNDCGYDYLDIYDGANTSAPYLGRFCFNDPGESVVASGSSLHFVFSSDGSVTDIGWVATISCIDLPCEDGSYIDEFAASRFNNSNGTVSWASNPWLEFGDDLSANSGNILITGGQLEFNNASNTRGIVRDIPLENVANAVLTFDFSESGPIDNNDLFVIQVFDGSVWNVVFSNADDFPDVSPRIDISDYADADSRVQITVNGLTSSDEFFFVDNFEVCYTELTTTSDFAVEAECEYIGNKWAQLSSSAASNQQYVIPKTGQNSLASPPADTNSYLTYTIDILEPGNYQLYGRVIAPTSDDDSFWVRVDGGTWYKWDNLSTIATWDWRQVWDSDNSDNPINFNLSVGTIKIDIAIREDGTQLDKLYLTKGGTIPTGQGPNASNCSASVADTDGDGIIDDIDIDDDNDGILDVDESPATISFSGTRTLLIGNDFNDMQVGDEVLYANAIRDCDDIFYDITITINTISPGVLVYATGLGMEIDDASAAADDHFTFTMRVLESGSATVANPAGTPATIQDFIFTPRDIDSNVGINHTEVIGISNSTAPDSVYFHPATVLQNGGFVNGQGPSGSWDFYRMAPISGFNNWTNNGNDTSNELPEHAVFMVFDNFSVIDIAFGRTGTAGNTSGENRLTSLFASKECDRDMDGIPNRIDLDLDNDGIYDVIEAGHGQADADNDGRIDGADVSSGSNGYFNAIETGSDNGVKNFTYSSSDNDALEDFFDLDSDADGCFDTQEADVPDPDNDGTAGSGTAASDINGLVISIVYTPPPSGAWQDSTATCLEICGNGVDDDGDGLPDDLDPDCDNYYLEAECGFPGANWNRGLDTLASNDDYVTISPGLNSTSMAPTGADDLLRFTVTVNNAGLYRIIARVYSQDGSDDSFWFRVDGGTWYNWNNWNTAATWQWLPVSDSDNGNTLIKWDLLAGVHTIDVAYREDGARLDKLHFTINGNTPEDEGNDAINCGRTITYNLFLPHKVRNRN